MSTELELHGIRCRMRGFPIYDDDELVGVMNEPDWEWDALNEDQQAEVRQLAVRLQKGSDRTWDVVFPFALGEFGVRCPHKWENHEPTWRECRWCRVGEELPGRIVRVAGRTMRVADPPPPVLRVPVAAGGLGFAIDEYEWDGARYAKKAPWAYQERERRDLP